MKRVYACFSTDIIHSGHLNIIKEAAKLGSLTIGIMSDEVIATYKRYPLIPLSERIEMFTAIRHVDDVVVQDSLNYDDVIEKIKPDYVVHGDNWRVGFQAKIRDRVIKKLDEYGGQLIEFPYTSTPTEDILSKLDKVLAMPENRRSRLKKLMEYKPCISVIEAHSGLSGLIAEKTKIATDDGFKEFDAMWVSSLCDSTVKGKPDIELVDMTSRIRTIEEIMDVTTKPIILDGDTGGMIEHFVFNVQTLERIGISAIIIEDKKGLKKNSLFGTNAKQTQADSADFCAKIKAGKNALKTQDFMIIARCESLILEQGMEDALSRCEAYVNAGADGIMIHSKKDNPDEILEFCDKFRPNNKGVPIVVVPTTYNTITEQELAEHGVNIVIHANHLIRSMFPAMQKTAQMILENSRSYETNQDCMCIKDIITLIPDH